MSNENSKTNNIEQPDSNESPIVESNAFGRLMRFWRHTLAYSQSDLASLLGTPTRHVSFLETGRSKPTRNMVLRVAEVFSLNERKTGVLLIAAGYIHVSENSLISKSMRENLSLMLTKHEPYPAFVVNNIGRIVQCNQSWLHLMLDAGLEHYLLQPDINAFNLYFSSDGLRHRIANWEDIACGMLLKIKEQELLSNSKELEELAIWLTAYPDLPENWALRAKDLNYSSGYDIEYANKKQKLLMRTIVSGIDPEQNHPVSQLQFHAFFPMNKATDQWWTRFSTKEPIDHTLIF